MENFENNTLINNFIIQNKPGLIGKLGSTESQNIYQMHFDSRLDFLNLNVEAIDCFRSDFFTADLEIGPGVFPLTPFSAKTWALLYVNAIKNMDVCAVWWKNFDKVILERYNPTISIPKNSDLLNHSGKREDSWFYHLGGKKVLVIHPMADTIYSQHKVFMDIWPGSEQFDLRCIRYPYQPVVGGETGFKSSHAVCESIVDQLASIDFDICLIGAGGNSLIIGNEIKKMKKLCIHMGGSLQLLFGIRGRRWEDQFSDEWRASTGYNSNPMWRFPFESDIPIQAKLVENGAYW